MATSPSPTRGILVGMLEDLLAELLHIPASSITDDLTMKHVAAWDSLKHMEVVAALEQQFGLQFTFDEIVAFQSVGEIKRVLRARGALS